jgi:hypothetical protein
LRVAAGSGVGVADPEDANVASALDAAAASWTLESENDGFGQHWPACR